MDTEEGDQLDRADMQRLAAGYDAALDALMDRHAQRIFHFLVRQLQDEADAEELAQEVFVRVYQHRLSYDPGHRFVTWLYAIAVNLARDCRRWRRRHPEVSLDADAGQDLPPMGQGLRDDCPLPSDSAEAAERAHAVQAAVAELPEDLRTPLLLSVYQGLSHQEIAGMLSCTPKAVEMRLYRARKALSARLVRFL